MRIQGTGNQNIFKLNMRTQNPELRGLSDIVEKMNANAGRLQKFDTLKLSFKARELLNENVAAKEKQSIDSSEEKQSIDSSEGSEKVLTRYGYLTKDEWAEDSIQSQRDGLRYIEDMIRFEKSKLDFTTSKISELENFLNGTGSHSNPNMAKETAQEYLKNYKESIRTDFSGFIDNNLYCYWANEYDNASGGLASKIMENQLNSLTGESLGLTGLSDDPEEIMKALENASKQVDTMLAKVESTFAEANDGKALESASWKLPFIQESLDLFSARMETISAETMNGPLNFNGEILVDKNGLIPNPSAKQ